MLNHQTIETWQKAKEKPWSSWEMFWKSLNTYDRRLFRLLQRTHKELGQGTQMFYYDWMSNKKEIEGFVKDRYNVDLNNLPK